MRSLLFLILLGIMGACSDKKEGKTGLWSTYNNREFKVPNGRLTPEALWAFGRIGESAVSPDGKTVAFTLKWYNKEENKGYSEIYSVPVSGGQLEQLTFNEGFNESNVVWKPDGSKIGYLSTKSGSSQIWEMNPDGSEQTIISNIEGGINGFKYSPDGQHVVYIKEVKLQPQVADIHPDLPKANARIINDLMYRHWDAWVDGKFSHIFVAEYDGTKITGDKDIMANEEWESPIRPHGGMEQIDISADGKTIAYACRKLKGREYSLSTNSDIYLYTIADGSTKNLTQGNMGYDLNPLFSPDGKKIAWQSMERDGYESDWNRLAVHSFDDNKTWYHKNTDLNAGSLCWNAQSSSVYFIADWHARDQIYSYDIVSGDIKCLTTGDVDYTSVALANGALVAQQMSIQKPAELYRIAADGSATELTYVNKPILDQIEMGKVEERWVKTTDGKQMLVWVIFPPKFDATKKYPTLLYCQGGPQSTVSQFWSYRWNFEIMAANDYIVVAPNRRGLPGFGKEWNEQISGDYGGQNIRDYLSAIDAVSAEPYVNRDRLGAVGASYGGFSVYFLAGNHQKRFKAFIAHDGMFNFESMMLETEENWFDHWDMGGPFWERDNAGAQKSYSFSPHKYVQNWDTPILVIHGGKDYRVPESQGMMAFNAARLRGIPAQFLYLPEENHWVLDCQNGILWQRTFFGWLDKWLKN